MGREARSVLGGVLNRWLSIMAHTRTHGLVRTDVTDVADSLDKGTQDTGQTRDRRGRQFR